MTITAQLAPTSQENKKMEINYPTVEAVLNATHELAPEGWIVTDEYPNQIGVHHPSLTDDQFISFGDVNGYFAFNDAFSSGCNGSMEGLTAAAEIAATFWVQVGKHYPELTQERNGVTAEQLLEVIKILKLQDKGE
jgi:hypothetical protein